MATVAHHLKDSGSLVIIIIVSIHMANLNPRTLCKSISIIIPRLVRWIR